MSGRGGRGRARGAGPAPDRGRGRGRGVVTLGGGRGGSPAISASSSTAGILAEHIQTVGVRRTAVGRAGTAVQVYTNHFGVDIPGEIIYHYDGASLIVHE